MHVLLYVLPVRQTRGGLRQKLILRDYPAAYLFFLGSKGIAVVRQHFSQQQSWN